MPIAPPRKYSDKIPIVTALSIDEPYVADPPKAVPAPPPAGEEAAGAGAEAAPAPAPAPARGGGKPARRGSSPSDEIPSV